MRSFFAVIVLTFAIGAFALEAPAEFVTQTLEPTGGTILRPKDWFYAEHHHGQTFAWTLSREDPAGGQPYATGVSIQTFMRIKESTGQSAKQFLLAFFANRSADATTHVIKTCKPVRQGLFIRQCLETQEGPYHILYSAFWGADDLDLGVLFTAGTPSELWETYAPTFDKMSAFELIDMKRFAE